MDTSYVICEVCSTAPIFQIWKLRLWEVRQKGISDLLQVKQDSVARPGLYYAVPQGSVNQSVIQHID